MIPVELQDDPLLVAEEPDERDAGLLHRIGVYAIIAVLFIRFSRITDDWSGELTGLHIGGLGLGLITSWIALIATIGTGGLKRAFTSRAGW